MDDVCAEFVNEAGDAPGGQKVKIGPNSDGIDGKPHGPNALEAGAVRSADHVRVVPAFQHATGEVTHLLLATAPGSFRVEVKNSHFLAFADRSTCPAHGTRCFEGLSGRAGICKSTRPDDGWGGRHKLPAYAEKAFDSTPNVL